LRKPSCNNNNHRRRQLCHPEHEQQKLNPQRKDGKARASSKSIIDIWENV
jgi:hypothetical protein